MKKCRRCKKDKELQQFYSRGDSKNHKRSICIECYNESARQTYKSKQSEDYKKYHSDKTAKWRNNNIEKAMLSRARSRAKNSNLEFNLTIEDIRIPEICPVLGIVLEKSCGIACDNSPSIDRIDSKSGYTKDNIVFISYKANRMKNDASLQEIEKLYIWMKDLLNKMENNDEKH